MKVNRLITTLAAMLLGACSCFSATLLAQGKLNVMTTTEDLASIGREVAGDRATIDFIARGYQDPHFVEAKPSFILKLQRADLLVVVGRELEIGWLPPLIQQSRNGKIIARDIADKLSQFRPADRAAFQQRLSDFTGRLDAAEKRWLAALAPYKGTKVVTYHQSYSNFADRFGLQVIGYVEPRPGIPPTPQHTLDVINEMKRQAVKLILVEPYFDLKTPNAIARETDAQVLVMPPSVGGVKDVPDYFKLFDYDTALLIDAIKKAGAGR